MKSMKLHVFFATLVSCVPVFTLPNPETPTTETSFKTKNANLWGFEIKNKQEDSVQIQLIQDGKSLLNASLGEAEVARSKGKKEEQHGYLRVRKENLTNKENPITGINPQKELILRIYSYTMPEHINKGDKERAIISYKILPNKDRKIIAVTREKGELRPQTGKYGGSSQSGLNLFKNIKQNEIEVTSE